MHILSKTVGPLAMIILVSTSIGRSLLSAQDSVLVSEVVITGNRYEVAVEHSGKSIYRLTQKDLEQQPGKSVSDILNEVPGVQITGNFGAPGTNIGYLVRGGATKSTLVLINGVPLNEPSGVDAQYDLRLLNVDQIESIEVLRGGLSTLYGTGAASAVINITMKSAQQGAQGTLDLHAGSFGTYGGSVNVSGGDKEFIYSLFAGIETSEGFSAASDEFATEPFDNDGQDLRTFRGTMKWDLDKGWSLQGLFAHELLDVDFDDFAFADAANTQTVEQTRVGLTPRFNYQRGDVQIKAIYNISDRAFDGSFPSFFGGRNFQLDAVHQHRFSNKIKGIWGVNVQQPSYEEQNTSTFEEGQFSIVDPYLSLFMESGNGLNVHVGTRLNTHSEYDTEILYNLNPSYVFGVGGNRMIKLLGSISTSNITPSLFQLYSPFFGSTDLVPEQSVNYEFGASFYDKGSLEVNLAYFIRDESNPIGFVSQFDDMGNFIGGAYENVSNDRNVNGWEFDAAWTIGQVRLTSYYTYVDSDQPASLRRIPNHKFGLGATGRFGDLSASLKYNRTGSRPEFDPMTFEQIELEAFGLLDIHMAQCLMDQKLELYGGLNNVLDTDFVGIPGFTTRGRTIEVGVKWMW